MIQERLVSIVVPIYNVEKYLARCLDSIRLQSYSNIEVIMVNDGSTDLSVNIAKEFEKKDIRFHLYSKENGGLSSGRNYGLVHAKGDYVCFIDSDDFIGKNFVQSLLSAFDSETDIVISDYAIYNAEDGKSYLHAKLLKDEEFINYNGKRQLIQYLITGEYPVMSVWKNMYRTSFLKNNNIVFVSERLIYSEDLLFHVEAYTKAFKVKMIPNIEFFHLVIPGSLSQSYRKNYFQMQKTLYLSIIEVLEEHYQKEFVDKYKNQFPSIIGSSMFGLCKCDFKQSINNIKAILKDELVKEWYGKRVTRKGLMRYWILFRVGYFKCPILIVITVKLMLLTNPLYRKIQRREEYKG